MFYSTCSIFFSVLCYTDTKLILERNSEELGWISYDGIFTPRWTLLQEAPKLCSESVKCGCKTRCQKRSGCKRAGIICTEL